MVDRPADPPGGVEIETQTVDRLIESCGTLRGELAKVIVGQDDVVTQLPE